MPTRSASEYTAFVKLQAQAQLKPTLTRTTPYNQGGQVANNALLQFSDMAYLTRGQVAPSRDVPRQFVMTRSNPKALSQVATLSGGGVLGGVVNRPQARSSGTTALVVPQTNLIQFPGSAR
jgi:hypothetical protein